MKRFKNILFVAESGQLNQAAFKRAVTLAENNQARLTAVTVVPRLAAGIGLPAGGAISEALQAEMVQERLQQLKVLLTSTDHHLDIPGKVLVGTPFIVIIQEVLRHGHDLVIKMPKESDWMEQFFGSDDMHLLRKCPTPVWLIKHKVKTPYRRIMAAVDVEPQDEEKGREEQLALNLQILEMAGSLALAEFAELHIIHAWGALGETAMRGAFIRTPEAQIHAYVEQVQRQHEKSFAGLIAKLEEKLGEETLHYLKPKTHLVKGVARKLIPQFAKSLGADLVVMGTVGRTGVPGLFMGNTAETILNQLNCSVMAIKPPGFRTPVEP